MQDMSSSGNSVHDNSKEESGGKFLRSVIRLDTHTQFMFYGFGEAFFFNSIYLSYGSGRALASSLYQINI